MVGDLSELEARRSAVLNDLAGIGDFRPGTLSVNYRRCGKPNCACSKPDHPGHGPQHLLTTKVQGRTVARNIRPGPELETVQIQVANYHRFKELVTEFIRINEQICDIRLRSDEAEDTAKKGASKTGSSLRSRKKSPPS